MAETLNCQSCKTDFSIEPDDFAFYEKMGIPPPTFCSGCRSVRRMSWRNEFCFYKRKCDMCQADILSLYSPDKPVPIYCPKCWWSDAWDPKDYATDFDFSKPFFPQFAELQKKVPALAILNDDGIGSTNCQYTNYFLHGKDCYLTVNSWKVENCLYSTTLAGPKDIVDSMALFSASQYVYSSIYVDVSYKCRNIYNAAALTDCAYCFDCRNCSDCFMCVGLRGKQYCFKNEQYTKEEYQKILASYKLDTYTGSLRAEKEFEEFRLTKPHHFAFFKNCVNCTGQYLVNAKNSQDCFLVHNLENSKYFERGDAVKDSYDGLSGGEQELCCETINADYSHRCAFTTYCHTDTETMYSDSCQSCQNVFGCVGLQKASYTILNKEYSKEEYFALREKIIEHMKKTGEWGEFFPTALSPFCYNETLAQGREPLTKEEATRKGFKWQDNMQMTTGKETIKEIPDSIHDIPDSLVNEILACQRCQRNYKIIERELQFYRQNGIPVPRLCFFCRNDDLYKKRGPTKLWQRSCMCEQGGHDHAEKCPNEFETSYAPERPEKVYCEGCYQNEVM